MPFGGEKILIFCNKVLKENIHIRFFEENAEDEEIWVAWGKFQPHDIHRGVGITFTTPKYGFKSIEKPANVFIELVRPIDGAKSNRLPFQFVPDVTNIDMPVIRKQKKVEESQNLFDFVATLRPSDISDYFFQEHQSSQSPQRTRYPQQQDQPSAQQSNAMQAENANYSGAGNYLQPQGHQLQNPEMMSLHQYSFEKLDTMLAADVDWMNNFE